MRLTRTEIAEACGVTPALISYYFREKDSLLSAVVKPLIAVYQRRLVSVLNEAADDAGRMRRIVRLLVEMNTDDGFVLDYMLNHVGLKNLDAEDQESADLFRETLTRAIAQLMSSGLWQQRDPEDTRLSLWATCRMMGDKLQHQIENQDLDGSARNDVLDKTVDFIVTLFAGAVPQDISMLGCARSG